jgi:hypothetical protein
MHTKLLNFHNCSSSIRSCACYFVVALVVVMMLVVAVEVAVVGHLK